MIMGSSSILIHEDRIEDGRLMVNYYKKVLPGKSCQDFESVKLVFFFSEMGRNKPELNNF
jgi:hypothetical protein